jgi:hypothetical protein
VPIVAGRRASGLLIGLIAIATSMAWWAPPAAAAGDSAADRYIIADPEAGWTKASETVLQAEIGSRATGIEGMQGSAEEMWIAPDASEAVMVWLGRFGGTVNLADESGLVQGMEHGCGFAGTSGTPSGVTGIPGSEEVICNVASPAAGISISGLVAWSEANVVALVIGFGAFSQVSLESVASQEYGQIPPGGIAGGGFPVLPVVGASAVIGLAAAVVYASSRRRSAPVLSSGAPAASAAPAPFPDPRGWPGASPGPAPPPAGGYGPALPVGSYGPPPSVAGYGPPPSTAAYPLPAPAGAQADGSPLSMPPAAVAPAPSLRWGAEWETAQPQALAPPPQPLAPGWYQNGSPYDLRYFDGSSWIAHKGWNGEAWVDLDCTG